MGAEVAENTAAAAGIETPAIVAASPVAAEPAHLDLVDAADRAGLDQTAKIAIGRQPAVGKHRQVHDAGRLRPLVHRLCFRRAGSERLLTEDVEAGVQCSHRHRVMQVVRGGNDQRV